MKSSFWAKVVSLPSATVFPWRPIASTSPTELVFPSGACYPADTAPSTVYQFEPNSESESRSSSLTLSFALIIKIKNISLFNYLRGLKCE